MVSLYLSVHILSVFINESAMLIHTFTGWFILNCLDAVRA